MHDCSGNKGCEAFVRTTSDIISRNNFPIKHLSNSVEEDLNAKFYEICNVSTAKNKTTEFWRLFKGSDIMHNQVVSIIIPIYKVEKYIHRCIDSIINQTYKNLEIILVDDGSPDNCGLICDAYKKKDKRIKVIHKKNGGLSEARNEGLKIASGEYIGFIDSDDWVEEKYIIYPPIEQ
jgi:cellulose synthase/poly-beta-1,6-N-acetylglucosamine synthase-like glycosyltransferase